MDEISGMIAASHWTTGPRELSTYSDLGPFIYYIQCGSFIKIGTSINPESRCNQLRRGGKAIRPSIWVEDPRLIAYVPGNVAKERSLHREFAGQRDQGEWFVINEELIEHVAEAQMQQCLMEVGIHNKHYEDKVAAGEWPVRATDVAAAYRNHLESKQRLDSEWVEALSA